MYIFFARYSPFPLKIFILKNVHKFCTIFEDFYCPVLFVSPFFVSTSATSIKNLNNEHVLMPTSWELPSNYNDGSSDLKNTPFAIANPSPQKHSETQVLA